MTTKEMRGHKSRSHPAGEPASMTTARQASRSQPLPHGVQINGFLRMLLSLSAPGFVLFLLLGIVQLTVPHEWKPTVLIGEAIATYEVTVIQETLMDRAEAEEKIAEARADGERAAEIKFQEDLKEIELAYNTELQTIQASLQIGMDAYKSLYDRANMIQDAVYKMEGIMLNYRQEAIRGTQGGSSVAANVADVGCFFVPELCGVGDRIRDDMADQMNRAGQKGAGSLAQNYLRDLPDPAQLQGQLMLPPPAPQER
ncbi:MAG: hypothetical protein AAGL10_06330 [Pseudomonadota bacterium]